MTRLSTLQLSVILQIIFSSSAFSQLSFAPIDTLNYTGAGKYGTYRNGNVYGADYNNDGLDDLFFMKGNRITRRLNLGGNKFGPEKVMFEDPNALYSISNFYDLNNDKHPDVVITTIDGIKILLSDNDIYVKSKQVGDLVTYGRLILNDVDNDHLPDLTCTIGSDIVRFKNVGNGFNGKSVLYTAQGSYIYDYEFNDLNKDTFLDLVVSVYDSGLKILLGNSDNTWTEAYSHGTPNSYLTEFEVGDLNLDGFKDVMFLQGNLYSAVYDNGTRKFTHQSVFPAGSIPENMYDFQLIDLKGDGTLDLVFNNFFSITVKQNNGTGQFMPNNVIVEDTHAPYSFATFNLNNDGLPDVLFSDLNKFWVIGFGASGNIGAKVSGGYFDDYWDVLSNDLDVDGFLDIVSISRTGSVQVRWGNAQYDYSTLSTYSIPQDAYFGAIADANGDDILDILFTRESNTNAINDILILAGKGLREFEEPISWKYFPDPGKLHLLDLNNNGKKELVMIERFGNRVGWLNFENSDYNEFFTNSITVGNGLKSMVDGDVNKDGYVDLLTANSFSKDVSILINNKLGGFIIETLKPNGSVSDVTGIQVFDYDGDQFDDVLLVVANSDKYALQVFINDKSGHLIYKASHEIFNVFAPEQISILDVDNDGDLDFIVSAWDYLKTNVFLNTNGVFENQGADVIATVGQSSRLYEDFNDDHRPDILSFNFLFGNVFLQLNNSVTEPQLSHTEITIEQVMTNSVLIKLNKATTDSRLVIVSKGETLPTPPVDKHFYASNLQFGIGAKLGADSYVVYSGTGESLQITGLKSSTKYVVTVIEFNVNKPQATIINYATAKVEKQFTTLNVPPQITPVADQSGLNMEAVLVSLTISDEDNLIKDLTYKVTSSNTAVIPDANVVLNLESSPAVLRIQPVAEGESVLEVKVTDPAGNNASVSFRYTSLIVGLEEMRDVKFVILPNPFSNTVILQHPKRDQPLNIYNSTGKLIKQFEFVPESVDLSDFSSGLFMLISADGLHVKALKY